MHVQIVEIVGPMGMHKILPKSQLHACPLLFLRNSIVLKSRLNTLMTKG